MEVVGVMRTHFEADNRPALELRADKSVDDEAAKVEMSNPIYPLVRASHLSTVGIVRPHT